jgi:hypothetical protein
VVEISPEWVTGPEQGKSSGRVATFSLWTGFFITNTKISKVIEDIRVYRSNEIGSDHYLLCAKVNFPPRWLNKGNKKTPLEQEEFFKVRLLNDESVRWLYRQRMKLHLNNTKESEIDIEK